MTDTHNNRTTEARHKYDRNEDSGTTPLDSGRDRAIQQEAEALAERTMPNAKPQASKHTPTLHQQVCFSCSRLFETASNAIYCDGCSAQKLLNKMEARNG